MAMGFLLKFETGPRQICQLRDLDPAIMSCKLAPLQRMDLRAIKI